MRALAAWLSGLDPRALEAPARWSVEWTRLAGGGDRGFWLAVALVALGLAWRALYARDAPELAPLARARLAGLRLATCAGLAAMLLEPVLVLERAGSVPSHLVVLVDASASMDLTDRYPDDERGRRLAERLGAADPQELGRLPRVELARRALARGLAEALAKGGARRVHVHAFGERLAPEELAPGADPAAALPPASRAGTALGLALDQALAAHRGQPLAGVLVVGDGQSNAGGDALAAARGARAAGVVVHALALGSDARARNVALAGLEHDPLVLVGDPFEVAPALESHGLAGEALVVVLEARRPGGAWSERGRATVVPDERGRLEPPRFGLAEDDAGELELRARVEDAGGETTLEDNEATGRVLVRSARLRVLLVAGLAFPEVQFLQNTLLRDPSIELSSFLQGADPGYVQRGDAPLGAPPRDAEELGAFDCVVLYDPRWDELSEGFGAGLVELVGERGGGLVYIAGEGGTEDLFERRVAQSEALLDLLPVVREPGLFRTRSEERAIAAELWRLAPTEAGARSEPFRFADHPEQNARLLAGLPGMYWHFPVTRAKPGAAVLAVHGDARMRSRYGPHVIVASHWFGAGRVTFLACDSTYRWRTLSEELFDGFWTRLIGGAGRAKLLGGLAPLTVSSDRARYAPGSVATLRARFRAGLDPSAAPPALAGRLSREGGETRELVLLPDPDDPGGYRAELELGASGAYHLAVQPHAAAAAGAPGEHRFVVEGLPVELATPWPDRAGLAALAGATGGRLFELEALDELGEAFEPGRIELEHQERHELWDAPLLAGAVFLALFLEWALRKRHRLT